MKNNHVVVGAAIIVFAAIGFLYMQILDLRSSVGLSPGAFPKFLFVLFALCGAGILWEGRAGQKTEKPDFAWESTLKLLLVFTLYVFGFEYLGFLASTVVFLAAAMYLMNEKRVKILVIVPVFTSVCIYFLFTELFLIPLP